MGRTVNWERNFLYNVLIFQHTSSHTFTMCDVADMSSNSADRGKSLDGGGEILPVSTGQYGKEKSNDSFFSLQEGLDS